MDTGREDPDDPADGSSSAGSDEAGAQAPTVRYRLCPRCARAVPVTSGERYCANDGTRLLDACPQCHAPITSPYARFCVRCGSGLQPR